MYNGFLVVETPAIPKIITQMVTRSEMTIFCSSLQPTIPGETIILMVFDLQGKINHGSFAFPFSKNERIFSV